MLSTAPLSNSAAGKIPVPVPFDRVASRSSMAAEPASVPSGTFADAVATARATNPTLKATDTAKREISNHGRSAPTNDTSQQTVVPVAQPTSPLHAAPGFVSPIAPIDAGTSSQLVAMSAPPLSSAARSSTPSNFIASASLSPQPPALTLSGAASTASSATPDDQIASSPKASAVPASSTGFSEIESNALPPQVNPNTKADPALQADLSASKSDVSTALAARAANVNLTELFPKNSPSEIQLVVNAPTVPAANDPTIAQKPIEKRDDTDPSASVDAAELSAPYQGNRGASVADSSKPDQGAILQRITAGLRDALNELPGVKAAATPVTGDSSSGNTSNQPESNSQLSNSGNDNSGTAGGGSSEETSAGALRTSLEAPPKTLTSDLGGVTNSGNPAVPVQQAPHSPAVSIAPSTEVPATPIPQAKSTSSPSQSLPTPQMLPASLSDVERASELYQRAANGEMHVAVQTELLGAIDLHATMRQSTLTATIGVQRSDVQMLLANDLPALQHALADQHFHVEHIAVLDSSLGAHSGAAGEQPRQQNPLPSNPVARGFGTSDVRHAEEFEIATVSTASSRAGGQVTKLSIHV